MTNASAQITSSTEDQDNYMDQFRPSGKNEKKKKTPLLGDSAIPIQALASAPYGGSMQLHLDDGPCLSDEYGASNTATAIVSRAEM